MTPLEKLIVKIVEQLQGAKITRVLNEVANESQGNTGQYAELLEQSGSASSVVKATIEKLCNEGELVEVRYVVPSEKHCTKSVIFPKNTQIIIKLGT